MLIDWFGRWEVLAAVVLVGVVLPLLLRGLVYLLKRVLYDRRLWGRRWGDPREVRLLAPQPHELNLHGLVVNRSNGGVAVLVDEPIPSGSRVRVRPLEAPDDAPWVTLLVRHCRPAGANFLLGCEFAEPLTRHTLGWFG